jgi:hypothetical protein
MAKLDIRLPIGTLFTLLGVLLVVFGLASDPSLYQRSLGINVNLWWGLVLLVAGALTLVISRRAILKQRDHAETEGGTTPGSAVL